MIGGKTSSAFVSSIVSRREGGAVRKMRCRKRRSGLRLGRKGRFSYRFAGENWNVLRYKTAVRNGNYA